MSDFQIAGKSSLAGQQISERLDGERARPRSSCRIREPFFGGNALLLPTHRHDLVENTTADEVENEDSYQVVRYMGLAMDPVPKEESAVDDLAMHLLRTMEYARRVIGRDLCSCKDIPFLVCGEWRRYVKTNVRVMDKNDILIVVQEDRQNKELGDPHSHLVADAIAVVQSKSRMRVLLDLEQLDFKKTVGIVMVGMSPAFFKVPVTRELIQAVQRGQYPATPTYHCRNAPAAPSQSPLSPY